LCRIDGQRHRSKFQCLRIALSRPLDGKLELPTMAAPCVGICYVAAQLCRIFYRLPIYFLDDISRFEPGGGGRGTGFDHGHGAAISKEWVLQREDRGRLIPPVYHVKSSRSGHWEPDADAVRTGNFTIATSVEKTADAAQAQSQRHRGRDDVHKFPG